MISPDELRQLLRTENGKVYWVNPSVHAPQKVGAEAGCLTIAHGGMPRWKIQIRGKVMQRSRVVFCLVHGKWPERTIDHINKDSLDDRPENLRDATRQQNCRNRETLNKVSSLPRGVYKNRDLFLAKITVDRKQIHLGMFRDPVEAEKAYRKARSEHFGEYA
jgi:hypothetical protein